MWIEHIGTIGMGAFVVLIAIKLGVMLIFKLKRNRKKSTETTEH